MDKQLAINFIQQHGDAVAQAQLRWVLAGERPSQPIIASLFSGQQDDGGFAPFWAAEYSSVDATCYRLAQAAQLGLNASETAVADALRFLLWRQQADGRFEEAADVADSAPPWAAPGHLAATLYLTANAGFWLAQSAATQAAAQQAAAFLEPYQQENGSLPAFLHANWLAAGLWQMVGQETAVAAALTYLQTRLGDMPADNLAWLLDTLLTAHVAHEVANEGWQLLRRMQDGDGRFASDEGQDIHITLLALRIAEIMERTE